MKTENTFKPEVGSEVTHVLYTDAKAGWVSRISPSGKKLWVELGEQRLLNGVESGEPDALTCAPGGFCGHISGTQRWEVKRAENPVVIAFTLRQTGKWKAVGSNTYAIGNSLIAGHRPHYDFNF